MSERADAQRRMRMIETMPGKWVSGCADKVAHPSKGKALAVKRAMLEEIYGEMEASQSYDEWEAASIRHDKEAKFLEAYKCGCCSKWHLGHRHRRMA